ncbi:BadF/BadG/BcrA/BcrD ATPase family protein [soil metagenome]
MSGLLLGVDGGANKTVALIAEPGGRVVGFGRSGSSDVHAADDPEQPIGRVAAAVRDAAQMAAVATRDVGTCVFSVCGADWPEDIALYASRLRMLLDLPSEPTVMNDAMGTLRAGSDGVGVALAMGTGAAIGARGPTGETWFSGMRLEPSGALEFGRHALALLIRGEYGPGPVPGFRDSALAALEVGSVEELMHRVTARGGLGDKGLGRLAAVLLEAGHREDPEALDFIHAQGRALSGYVHAAAERVGLPAEGGTLVVSGGLLRHHCTTFLDSVVASLPAFTVVRPSVEPAFGALLWAADEAGTTLDSQVLRESGPGAAYFETL